MTRLTHTDTRVVTDLELRLLAKITDLEAKVIGTKVPIAEKNKILNEYANIYFRSINARFSTLSSGGGQWPPIKPVSKKRKKVAARGRNAILIDTLQLFNSTRPTGGPGQVRRLDTANLSVRVGIGGNAKHKDSRRKKNPTIGRLAAIHQHLRPIIIPASPKVLEKMRLRTTFWVNKQLKRAARNG